MVEKYMGGDRRKGRQRDEEGNMRGQICLYFVFCCCFWLSAESPVHFFGSFSTNRSLAACEQLSRAGYTELAWVSGGLDTVRPGQVETTPDNKDLRYSAIGGLSAIVGWTEVQQEESKDEDGSFGLVLKVVSISN